MSICGTPPPAVFDISDKHCGEIVVNGEYKQGKYLDASNFITLTVTVTEPGTYELLAISKNGYYFSDNGTFPAAGSYTLMLSGTGTPSKGYTTGEAGDKLTIYLDKRRESDCHPNVFVSRAAVSYMVECATIRVPDACFIGLKLTEADKLAFTVNVTSPGYWNINTDKVNGYSFAGSGIFETTGKVEIELQAMGTPIASGKNAFTLVTNSDMANTCPAIDVEVKDISFSVDCTNAVVKGDYLQDEAATANHTVILPITVYATGVTTLKTNEVGGVYFSSGPLTLDSMGEHEIVLTANGIPTTSGVNTYILMSADGLTQSCSFDVSVAAQPVNYLLDCSKTVRHGVYSPGIAMTQENTLEVMVDVKYPGEYLIKTNEVNGVSFSATGLFESIGKQSVLLRAKGIPVDGGTYNYAISGNSSVGVNVCSQSIDFRYRTINVLGLGAGVYQPASSDQIHSSKAIVKTAANFGPKGILKVESIELVDGEGSKGVYLKNFINNNKIDVIVIGFAYSTDNEVIKILADFVKNKKGVVIHAQENNPEKYKEYA
ncbi:hypothetical protein VSO92_04635 [Myroides pelagicus]|uniref:hypothetical protein n=1 Tax=Myroides pelagicus TaxID=270914 RepID=UPI002DBFD8C7|nr:hypothetical protein [Myroides pelagicus]MEC4113392.1 hypothetical protein [Myroides pelagicus]